jgi:hypothetical protein
MHGMNEIVYIAHSFISHVETYIVAWHAYIVIIIMGGSKSKRKAKLIVLFSLYHTRMCLAHCKKSHIVLHQTIDIK